MTRHVDLLVEVGAALPMTDVDVVYDAVVAVDEGRIVHVGAGSELERDAFSANRVIRDEDAVVLPGLVNTHSHVGAHFWGTLCDDENIITALYHLWFPMERAFDHEMTFAASRLGYWDAVRAGVTTMANDEYFPDATAKAATELGIRSLVADRVNEFPLDHPPRYNESIKQLEIDYDRAKAEHALAKNVEFIERWREHELVIPCLGPHAPDLLSTDMLLKAARLAEDLQVKMLIHVAQSEGEVDFVRRVKGSKGSIHYLSEIGFLSPRVQAAHMVWLDDEEIDLAAATGMGMSWTPTIMMACHSYAPLPKHMASGIRIGFGTDCFSMDVLEEMRYAIYTANYVHRNAAFQLNARDVVEMATIGGARCLGLDDEIGTLEVGKRADLAVINLRDAQLIPNTNYFETIAYKAKSRNVTHTIVEGRVIYGEGRLQVADETEIFEHASKLARTWVERSRDVLEQHAVDRRIQPHFFGDPVAMTGRSR